MVLLKNMAAILLSLSPIVQYPAAQSYAVNNNLSGSSLTATKTNFIANQTNVIRNAGTLYIDKDSSLTISDDQVPGRMRAIPVAFIARSVNPGRNL